jgi:3'-5' exoribonuclease
MKQNYPPEAEFICVRQLKDGDSVLQYFQLIAKDLRKTRSGQDYLDLTLGDSSGTITGKMWSDAIRKWGHDFSAGDFVKMEGRVESYRDRSQIIVDKIRRADPAEIPDVSILIRTSQREPESLLEELKAVAATLQPESLSEVVLHILNKYSPVLITCPAARMIHHAYKGGLVEHVCAVTRKVEAILQIEKNINRGVALAGAILHDIGKIAEFSANGQDRTPEGRLIGHVALGVRLVQEAAFERGVVDDAWLAEIEHIILSHHGETQFGAPVRPLTREAMLVHFIDNLDSKLKIIDEALEAADSAGFSPHNKWLEGRAFAGSKPDAEEDKDGNNAREIGGD